MFVVVYRVVPRRPELMEKEKAVPAPHHRHRCYLTRAQRPSCDQIIATVVVGGVGGFRHRPSPRIRTRRSVTIITITAHRNKFNRGALISADRLTRGQIESHHIRRGLQVFVLRKCPVQIVVRPHHAAPACVRVDDAGNYVGG
jgi:hypothetical protein